MKKYTTYTDIKTFEDACAVEKINAKKVIPDFKDFPAKDRKAMQAHTRLVIIARAINRLANAGKPWKPDWDNGEWDKYYPWFYMTSSSGFRFDGYAYWNAYSGVGSRLCFFSREAAKYAGEQFVKLYKEYFVM